MDITNTAQTVSPAFFEALLGVREDLRLAQDPWWIIGSAAMALQGVEGLDIDDIDILMSPDDARQVLATKDLLPMHGEEESRFRSEVYVAWTSGFYRIEVMANFAVLAEDEWINIQPRSRVAVDMPAGPVFIPSVNDLIAMCGLFGRPKDEARKKLLQAFISGK
jgi:hypothetical protein